MLKALILFLLTTNLAQSKYIFLKATKKLYLTKSIVMENYYIEIKNRTKSPLKEFEISMTDNKFAKLKSFKVSEIKTMYHQTTVDSFGNINISVIWNWEMQVEREHNPS